ncbi:MAG: hypothetical protein AMXMBFR84_39920 [Candidatus Hydrogenedentota bacterium]
MDDRATGRIYIRDLQCRCIVGINPEERENKQDVIINVVLETDLSRAAETDAIEDTVDYKKVKVAIIDMVEHSSFYLVERLADRIAAVCLEDGRVCAAEITVDKPGALRFARSVAIQVRRERGDGKR